MVVILMIGTSNTELSRMIGHIGLSANKANHKNSSEYGNTL
jgi:hypothetical protein